MVEWLYKLPGNLLAWAIIVLASVSAWPMMVAWTMENDNKLDKAEAIVGGVFWEAAWLAGLYFGARWLEAALHAAGG